MDAGVERHAVRAAAAQVDGFKRAELAETSATERDAAAGDFQSVAVCATILAGIFTVINQRVAAVASQQSIIAGAPDQHVVAGSTAQDVVAGAPLKRVIAKPAVELVVTAQSVQSINTGQAAQGIGARAAMPTPRESRIILGNSDEKRRGR